MDITMNTLAQPAAAITPLNTDNTGSPVATSVTSVAAVGGKTQASLTPVKAATIAKNATSVKQAVSQLNDHVQTMQRALLFSVDKGSGTMVVKIVDTQSNQVIRQIPTEEALRMAQDLTAQGNKTAFNIFSSKA